ncbi:MAG: polysaccharide deacetylase family protein [Burkholderiales bacterium]|nr:polysaccharide deacetylase family protein [Burkholderiales bacterium]
MQSQIRSARGQVEESIATGRRWRPVPAIRMSMLLHVSGLAAIAVSPPSWPYVTAAVACNHLLLGLAGMLPRSALLGANLRRLPQSAVARDEIALTFDDGPDPTVTPQVLDVLDRHGAKASFFCVGAHAAQYPDLVQEIVRRGHRVENHSNRHSPAFAAYGLDRLQRDIAAAQQTLQTLSGRTPAFFRAPMGLRNPLLDPVLARLGLRYVSWTRRGFDAVDRDASAVLARLTRGLAAGDLLVLHDGAMTRRRGAPPVVLSVLPALLEKIEALKLRAVTLADGFRLPCP